MDQLLTFATRVLLICPTESESPDPWLSGDHFGALLAGAELPARPFVSGAPWKFLVSYFNNQMEESSIGTAFKSMLTGHYWKFLLEHLQIEQAF
jgi:hypothetical protein